MKSLTIRNFTRFNIEEDLPIIKNGEAIGNISPTNNTYSMEGQTFHIYQCSYFVSINETIMVRTNTEDGFITVDNYKKSKSFNLYTVPTQNLLFVDAPTSISKGFLDSIERQYSDKVQTRVFSFDFQKIGEYQNNAKAIYFSVDDDLIDNKIFFGNGVDQDDEAVLAIDNSSATYLMVEIDIRNKARTIGFSKKGAIVIYNTPHDIDNLENPYLQLSFDAVNLLTNIR